MQMPEVFTTTQAAQILKLPPSVVHGWAAAGVVTPQIDTTGPGHYRGWTFRDMLPLACAQNLREDGAGHDRVRRAAQLVRGFLEQEDPTWEGAPWVDRYLLVNPRLRIADSREFLEWLEEPLEKRYYLDLAYIAVRLQEKIEHWRLEAAKPGSA
jgi:DNA-binding transcriptional MerR regulator